jgi:hypothetical protein
MSELRATLPSNWEPELEVENFGLWFGKWSDKLDFRFLEWGEYRAG